MNLPTIRTGRTVATPILIGATETDYMVDALDGRGLGLVWPGASHRRFANSRDLSTQSTLTEACERLADKHGL